MTLVPRPKTLIDTSDVNTDVPLSRRGEQRGSRCSPGVAAIARRKSHYVAASARNEHRERPEHGVQCLLDE